MTNALLSSADKVINGLWISPDGKPLSNLERLCIYSFCANGHDFHLWTYGDINGLPQDAPGGNVVLRDAAEILPKSKMFFVKKSLAGFSDWFRWELMRQIGGWYVDMDFACLRPLAFNDETVFVNESTRFVNSNFIKFPKGHFVAEAMANACANPGRIAPWDTSGRRWSKRGRRLLFWKNAHEKQGWGESGGPKGFSLAARHFGIFQNAKPSWVSDFVALAGLNYLVDDELHNIGVLDGVLKHSYAIHFANEGWRSSGWDKNGDFHPNSPFEILKRRYLPELRI